MWKILTYTVALPGVGLCYLNAEMLEKEHKEHFHRPDFAPFEYLCIRTKVNKPFNPVTTVAAFDFLFVTIIITRSCIACSPCLV